MKNLVYLAVNVNNGKTYIGETSKTMSDRMYTHMSTQKSLFGKHLAENPKNFVFVPIIFMRSIHFENVSLTHKSHIRKKIESHYIKAFKPQYNQKSHSSSFRTTQNSQKIIQRFTSSTPAFIKKWIFATYKITSDNFSVFSYALDHTLTTIPNNSSIKIQQKSHGYQLTDFTALHTFHGSSQVFEKNTFVGFFRDFIQKNSLKVLSLNIKLFNPFYIPFGKLVCDKTYMKKLPIHKMITMQCMAEKLGMNTLIHKIRQNVLGKYGCTLYRRYNVQIPNNIHFDTKKLKLSLHKFLRNPSSPMLHPSKNFYCSHNHT